MLGLSKEDIEKNKDNLGFVGPKLDQAEIKYLFQTVRVDSDPVALHSNNLDCLAFPEIFPRGTGGSTTERTVKLYDADYEKKFKAIYDFICSDLQPLGEVIHDFGRTGYQSRLMEHMHCLFWIKDVPIIGVSTPQEVLDFITKKICCKLPAAVDDPEMHRLVKL